MYAKQMLVGWLIHAQPELNSSSNRVIVSYETWGKSEPQSLHVH